VPLEFAPSAIQPIEKTHIFPSARCAHPEIRMKIANAGPPGVSEMRGRTNDDIVIDSQYIEIIVFILPPSSHIRISERVALSVRPGERQSARQRWRPRAARDPGDSAFSRSAVALDRAA
jgi:hypothetical protein